MFDYFCFGISLFLFFSMHFSLSWICPGSFCPLPRIFFLVRSRHEDFLAGFYRNKAKEKCSDVLTLQLTSLSQLTFSQTLKLRLIERCCSS